MRFSKGIYCTLFSCLRFFAIAGNVLAAFLAVMLLAPKLIGMEPYIVMSGSMEPVIRTGAVAYVDTRTPSFSEGDIITFRSGQTLVTHRVVQRNNGVSITKGDANDVPDASPVTEDQVVGVYRFSIPGLGYLINTAGDRGGFAAGMWLIGLNLLTGILPLPGKSEAGGFNHADRGSGWSMEYDEEAAEEVLILDSEQDLEWIDFENNYENV